MRAFLLVALVAAASATTYFQETFDNESWESRWIQSKSKSDFGKFKLSHGVFYGDQEISQGIQTSQDARFYSLSAKFPEAFSNEGKDLVIQFSVKHEQKIDCGGGYIKLLFADANLEDFHGGENETPYAIMFGPDICGSATKKIHFIINHDGENHLTKKSIPPPTDEFSHTYTLVLHADQSWEVFVDNESKATGTLEEDFDILPPKKIKDPEASKPEDWDDRAKIDDPEDVKPDDWDNEPEFIPDPDAEKPDDWDDELDGDWEAPQIPNPNYKGEWRPKKIDNPNYKGVWVHPMIDNPEYEHNPNIYKFSNLGAIGLDLWQVKSGTIFDNFYVGDSLDEAKELHEATVGKIIDEEKAMKNKQDEEARKKAEEEAAAAEEEEEEEYDFDFPEEEDEESAKDEL